MTLEQDLRLQCLKIASHPDKQVGQIITEANLLYRFILEGKVNGVNATRD